MLVHTLKTIHEKYKDSLAKLQDVTSGIKEYQKEQMTEAKQCNKRPTETGFLGSNFMVTSCDSVNHS